MCLISPGRAGQGPELGKAEGNPAPRVPVLSGAAFQEVKLESAPEPCCLQGLWRWTMEKPQYGFSFVS